MLSPIKDSEQSPDSPVSMHHYSKESGKKLKKLNNVTNQKDMMRCEICYKNSK
jgi:hypothetical protein